MLADPNVALGRLAVTLLSGDPPDLERGADSAIRRRLAGLFLYGLSAPGGDPNAVHGTLAGEALRRAAQREAAEDAAARDEIATVLAALASRGLCPVVLKGRSLALSVWPRPAFRPPGDLDLLVERAAVPAAVDALGALGYRSTWSERPSRFRPSPHDDTLAPPIGGLVIVDLHSRLFRSVGRRIDDALVLARSRQTALDGHPVRQLDEADGLLFLLVHAAKHAVSRLKWLLDLYAVALRTDAATWSQVAERAAASRTRRPVFAAARLLAGLPGVAMEQKVLEAARPALHIERALASLITVERALREITPTRAEQYMLEVLLEESLLTRARMAVGMLERMITFG